MPLLNYTTEVDAKKSIDQIQAMLARAGAQRVSVDYSLAGGQPVVSAISFVMPKVFGERPFRMPANIDAIERTLKRQKVPPRYATREHCERVGWRILKDWLEAQLAIVESGMVTLDEVMLPYLVAGPKGETFYRLARESQLALEAPEH